VTASELAITGNIMVAALDLTMAIVIITPDRRRPDMSPVLWNLMRLSFFVIFMSEFGRHAFLGLRAVYGMHTPSQEDPIAIALNITQILVMPLIFYIIYRVKKDLAHREMLRRRQMDKVSQEIRNNVKDIKNELQREPSVRQMTQQIKDAVTARVEKHMSDLKNAVEDTVDSIGEEIDRYGDKDDKRP
jgi:hypothetical protein